VNRYPYQANAQLVNILAWYRHWLYTTGLFLTTECTSIKWVWICELKGNNTRRYQTTMFTVPVTKRCQSLSRQRNNGWYPLIYENVLAFWFLIGLVYFCIFKTISHYQRYYGRKDRTPICLSLIPTDSG
jgi:hypothetical protein